MSGGVFEEDDVDEITYRNLLAELQPELGGRAFIIEEKPHTSQVFTPTRFCGQEPSVVYVDEKEARAALAAYDEAFPLWDHRLAVMYREPEDALKRVAELEKRVEELMRVAYHNGESP